MDILKDVEERLIEAKVKPAERVHEVIDAVRRDYYGEKHYVSRFGESPKQVISRRNAEIVRDYMRGERIKFLARKYGVSVKRIYAVLKISRSLPTNET